MSVELLWVEVHSPDWDARNQRARNVPFASPDIHGGRTFHDEPKECLHRRLGSILQQAATYSWQISHPNFLLILKIE